MFIRNDVLLLVAIVFKASSAEFAAPVGVVVSNAPECAKIGRTALERGGAAVDAAISTLLCEGVTLPHSMGIGGGFEMTIYINREKRATTLTATETAPASATSNMFGGDANLASKGGASVAIPGEVMGYWEAHQRYGRLPWASLMAPTIDLCFRGFSVTPSLARTLAGEEWQIRKDPGLRETFINPLTNRTYEAGDYLRQPVLGQTLSIIARDGAAALYDGVLTRPLVDELAKLNGSITVDDMRNYRPLWHEAVRSELPNGQILYSSQLPNFGAVLAFMLNVLNGFLDTDDINTVTNWQRIVETFEYGYAYRTRLGDPDFVPGMESVLQELLSTSHAVEVRGNISDTRTYNDPRHYGAEFYGVSDKGTSNIVVLAPNGDAVCVTSALNQNFGSGILSLTTGIILNAEMNDFSAPNIVNNFGTITSPLNYIEPGKRAISSVAATVIVDENGDVALVVGAAGTAKLTSVALVIMRCLWFGETLFGAVSSRRLHHQLIPMRIEAEEGFDQEILEGLAAIGHNITVISNTDGLSTVTAIRQRNGTVHGTYDERRGGSVSYYG